MPLLKAQIDPRSILIMTERDLYGKIIPKASNVFSNYYTNLYLFIEGKKIGMACQLELRNQDFGNIDPNLFCSEVFKLNLSQWLKTYHLNIFNINQFYFRDELKIINDQVDPEFDVQVNDSLYFELVEQSKKYSQLKDDFNFCRDKLLEFVDYNPPYLKQLSNKIYNYLRFIRICIDSSNYGNLQGWYNEKYSTVHGAFEELLRRMDPNNPTYTYHVDSIKRTLFSFKAADMWENIPSILVR